MGRGHGGAADAALQHEGPVEEASFSPDGRRVVTASADHSARVWDAETGKPLTEPLRHGARGGVRVVQPGRPPGRHRQPPGDGAGVGRGDRETR